MAVAAPFIPYVMAGASALGSVSQYQEQAAVAKAGARQQTIQNRMTVDAALDSYSDLNAQEKQSLRESLNASLETQLQAVQERATARLYAASSGTGGVSVDNIMNDIAYREGKNVNTIIRNTRFNQEEFRRQGEAIRAGAQRNMGTRVFNKPSAFAAGLSGIGGVASSYLGGAEIADRLR